MVSKGAKENYDKTQEDYPLLTSAGYQFAHERPTNNSTNGHQPHYPTDGGLAAP
jgi:hypothetical protein